MTTASTRVAQIPARMALELLALVVSLALALGACASPSKSSDRYLVLASGRFT